MASSNVFTNLPNGQKIPLLGLGTWQSEPAKVRQAVEVAISCGYRHIDGAYAYRNEREVGEGIKAKIDDGTIKREDVFVTTKLWMLYHQPDDVEVGCRKSLTDLGLEYIDLYLIHWPMALVKDKGFFPLDAEGFLIPDDSIDYVNTWKAMEKLVDKGLVRAIGVSNFTIPQLQQILDLPPKHPIANVQVELHPSFPQSSLVDFCQSKGITVTAYSPLGSPARPGPKEDSDPELLEEPVVCELAKKRGKTPAQILIRYQIHRGVIVIPKSVTPSRIQQNFEALNFELTDDEFQQLVKLDQNHRILWFPMASKCKYYPFK